MTTLELLQEAYNILREVEGAVRNITIWPSAQQFRDSVVRDTRINNFLNECDKQEAHG